MRKLKLLCLCGLTAAVLMTGCAGSTDTTNVNLGSATVSEYRGVKVNVAAPEVTDDEVDQKIQTNLKQNPNEVEVDRAAKDGDIVNIDYKGTKDGEAFDGGTAEGTDLTLGSKTMIDGFEDGLIGAKKGETKTLNLTFPEDYREESVSKICCPSASVKLLVVGSSVANSLSSAKIPAPVRRFNNVDFPAFV